MLNKQSIIKINVKPILLSILAILAFGAGISWWVAKSTATDMRYELLQQARIAARSISTDHISSLSGSPNDLNTVAYQRIKAQLKSMREARPQCKFLYLMGKQPDGKIFFFVDSLHEDSKDYAPPGLIYEEVSDSYTHAFDAMEESVVGPVTDRWGTLVTALVPIKSPRTGNLLAMLGMDVEASHWNKEIIRRCSGPFVVTLLMVILILLFSLRENTVQLLRKREEELKYRTEFERLVSKISSKFAGLKLKDLDVEIEQALASIGTFTGVDRAYVFLFRKNRDRADNTHEWCAENIVPQIDNLKNISIKDELPWFSDFIQQNEVFEIPDISALPPDARAERRHFESQGIQSLIVVPMVLEERLIGFLGFDTVSQKKKWADDDQVILRAVGEVFSNAIARRRIEIILRESEERYRLLFHQSPIGFIHVDEKGVIIDVNAGYARMIGTSREKLIGFDTFRVTEPNMQRAMRVALDGKRGYFTGKFQSVLTGKIIACDVITQGIRDTNGNLMGAIVTVEDMTEQKKLQESLRRSEFYLKQAQSVAGVGSWHLDVPNNVLTWSDQTYRIFGLEIQAPLSISVFLDCVHPEDRSKVESAWEAAMKSEPFNIEHRIISGDGVRWVHEKAQITFDPDGLPLEAIGTVHDITGIKQAEKALRESEEKFRAVFDQAAVGVSLTSMQTGSILQVNQKYCDIIGYSEDELKRISAKEITHAGDLQAELHNIGKMKEGKLKEFSLEKRYIGRDGSEIWVNLTVSRMWHDGEEPARYITVIQDITKRKFMEAEVKQLSGLLPICASCKKIRDDGGYWQQIESYVRDHSEAEFSHGICPECAKKLYSDLVKNDN